MSSAQSNTSKVGVKSVTIRRAEGPSALCKTVKFATLAQANQHLAQNAETVESDPKYRGCYDKHDFWVEFKDGYTYEGRIDLHHPSYAPPEKVGRHIIEFMRFYGGLATEDDLPKHLLPIEKYHQYLSINGGLKDSAPYVEFLNKYDLQD